MTRPYYHIFGDNWDSYRKTKREALKVYKEMKDKGFENLRLYKQINENEEEYILGIGEFPQ